MPILFLMCGLPGAGKTTWAKKLEQERPALRLTPDEWMSALIDGGYSEKKRSAIEALQWEVAAQVLVSDIDVVLDWGFWGKSEREDFRSRAAALGAQSKICFLDVRYEELLTRLKARNANLPPDTFHVSEAQLAIWSGWFQPPTDDELE